MIYWSDQSLSAILVVLCWWLAHQNATERRYMGKVVATAFSALGMMILANMLFRSFRGFEHILPWSLLVSKATLAVVLTLKGWRMKQLSDVHFQTSSE